MEKRRAYRAKKETANQELKAIIQLWRAQRNFLNQSLEDSIYAGFSKTQQQTPEQYLEPLCERLIDYVSAGHFEVYEKLLGPDRHLSLDKVEMVKNIYHHLEDSTDQALRFNDKYDFDSNSYSNEALTSNDLYKLNRSLAVRFVLEEQLVEILQE